MAGKQGRRVLGLLGVLLLLCLATAAMSALVNTRLPTASAGVDRLSAAEQARIGEYFHLRQTLGDTVWPGWGQADIPIIVYNEAYAFLIGLAEPAPGWIKVPQEEALGEPWQPMPDETVAGRPTYRQPLPGGVTPQAFAVRVGDRWVASMTTREWMQIMVRSQFQQQMPPLVRQIFPYPLLNRLFVSSSDWYVSLMAHEAFHAYTGLVAPARLAAAEKATSWEGDYPWADEGLTAAWQAELDLLADGAGATSPAAAADLARQFLARRERRRVEAGLDPALTDYERQREWLEGLAKYAELAIWRAAATPAYSAEPAFAALPDYDGYDGYQQRWEQEVAQIRRMARDEGDGRFYYSGLAQATLLDRLLPGWQAQAMNDGVFLEDLLAAAVGAAPDG